MKFFQSEPYVNCVLGLMAVVVAFALYLIITDQQDSHSQYRQHQVTLKSNIDATVVVLNGNGLGTGVLVNNKQVLTAAHVIQDKKSPVYVMLKGSNQLYAIQSNIVTDDNDYALLTLQRPVKNVPVTLNCSTPEIGSQVYAIGHPHGFRWMVRWGYVAMDSIVYNPQVALPEEIQQKLDNQYTIDSAIMHGNSGGGVYDHNNNWVGMADMVIQGPFGGYFNISMIVKPEIACDFLTNSKVKFNSIKQ